MPAIAAHELTKDYAIGFWRKRPYRALDRLTLDVGAGEVFGFLGPNGAGKTTTLKLLMQLVYPTAGRAEILGRPLGDPSVKRRIGYLPENPYFYDHLTAEELLVYYASLFGIRGAARASRAARLLDEVGVGAERRLQLRKFSKGMLQRVGIAQALINEPELVILDEPMSGLDPLGRRDVRALILRLRDSGCTVFFSSHVLSDAEALCHRVAILAKGRLVTAFLENFFARYVEYDFTAALEQLQQAGMGRGNPRPARRGAGDRAQIHVRFVQHLARRAAAGRSEERARHARDRLGDTLARQIESRDGVGLLVQVVDPALEGAAFGIEKQQALRPLAILPRRQQQRHSGLAARAGDAGRRDEGAREGEREGLGGEGGWEGGGKKEEGEDCPYRKPCRLMRCALRNLTPGPSPVSLPGPRRERGGLTERMALVGCVLFPRLWGEIGFS